MSLKFSATTHSFRIGGWTNSDGNTALSSWNVFFFRKEIQWFEIKSKRASATADRWNNCRLLDEVFLFKFFLLFLFCFEREHDSSTCHDPIESSRADRAGRRDRENVHAPLVCFGFLFFFCCFVSCVLRRFPTGVTRNPRGCTNRASPAGTERQNSIWSMMNENSLFFSQCSYAIRSRCVFSLWMNVRPWGEIQQAVWWPFNNVPNK